MEIKLWKKPKNVTLVEGFPGFGLVGTIATEFLIDHLQTEMIGKITFDDTPPMIAIHDSKVVEPLGIFYNKKYNLALLHAMTASAGFEWKISRVVFDLAKALDAREIICLEGVGSPQDVQVKSNQTFFYSSDSKRSDRLSKSGIAPLKEGIIMGVTGALLVSAEKVPVTAIFAETPTNLPDSKAAANVIIALDKHLGLNVDPKPLMKKAEDVEAKLKDIFSKSQEATEMAEKKKLSYVG
ncbi:proteasome assembly chaperone family protein [Candidatus Woesearchaeota archaeon]|nr:proteasome assembly chaperone family protein [Candidatus Woesearchaeota archaeon]